MDRRDFLRVSALGLGAAFAESGLARAAGERLKIGQIGTGHSHAAGKMEAIRRLGDLFEVVGIAEPDEGLRQAAMKRNEYAGLRWMEVDELLASPGLAAVAVETAMKDSAATARRCLEAGKHIHLDKPGALSPESFREMREEGRRRGLIVQMGYMLRYNPAFQLLFRAVREGWFGEILEVDAAMGKLAGDGLRTELRDLPGAGMFELACHLVDAVVTILGAPKAVHAFNRKTKAPGDALPDNQLAVLEYERATVTLRCNHVDPFGGPRRKFVVHGTRGGMEIEPLESGKGVLYLSEVREGFAKGRRNFELKMPKGRYDEEFVDLARVLRKEGEFAWSADHDLAVFDTVWRASGAGE